jgi:Protein of unknown function (DUF2804)
MTTPLMRGGRPYKAWTWVGAFGPELMLCAARVRIGGVPVAWWAVWDRASGRMVQRDARGHGGVEVSPTALRIRGRAVHADLEIGDGAAVEVTSPHGAQEIWTRKRAGVEARGTVMLRGEPRAVALRAVVDESAGYHARHTAWRWSAGLGRAEDGRRVAWNLVDGVHDAGAASERTLWLDGEPHEVPPQEFAADLSRVGELRFREWSSRESHLNLGIVRNRYRQPFGEFSGRLPGGLALAEGYGVMEEHDVLW